MGVIKFFLFFILLSPQLVEASLTCAKVFSKENTPGFWSDPYLPYKSYSSNYRGLIPAGLGLLKTKEVPQEIAIQLLYKEHHMRQNTPLLDLRSVEISNLEAGDYKQIFAEGPEGKLRKMETVGALEGAIDLLYKAYGSQGVERKALLPEIMKQDAQEAPYVTHFLTVRWLQPLAHAQILTSTSPKVKLHVEKAWPDQSAAFGRQNPTERIGEIGRLFALSPNKKPFKIYEHTLKVDDLKKEDTDFFFFLNLMETIHWSLFDARLDRVVQQTTPTVEKVLLKKGIPLDAGKRYEVSKKWDDNGKQKEVTEIIYSFDRSAMEKISDFLMLQLMQRWIKEIQTHPFYKNHPKFFFEFSARNLASLERLGVIGSNPETSFIVLSREFLDPYYNSDSTVKLTLAIESTMIDPLKKYLDSKE